MISRNIVFDTNVLVSAALKEASNPALILLAILNREVAVLICPSIVAEYRDVFARPKFCKWKFPPLWFDYFVSQSIYLDRDPPIWPLEGPDQGDLVFLSLAHQQGAMLVAGNLKDYPESIRQGVSVVDPKQYLDWLKSVS